ncbi:retron St85 family RNA-directed DNA polymerase [Rahnella variigena]|uniref:retron St85 family RNA-directed DNA polymerase n=1 Tax=Rahnella variigena TaxID=574964 RepID=UPI00132FB0D6|nr:retron St85 family RNA-directed DNA polymerase [Rahnella variigena]
MTIVEYISQGLFISESEFVSYTNTMPRRYKQFYIKKRNGEDRLIAQPAKTVKNLQLTVVGLLRDELRIHPAAMAYVKGRSIKDNAQKHVHNQFLLKMDFKNFFLSIKPAMFLMCLKKQGVNLDERDEHVISNIFFWKLRRNSTLRLSIGAPSSPFVSNVVMYYFDEAVESLCRMLGVVYTRYADDLTFSTNKKNVLFELPSVVKNVLNDVGLKAIKVNKDKTVFSSKKFNRHVTGVTLNNSGELSLGRERKRTISAMIHHHKLGLLNNEDVTKLKGYLGFAKYVEPLFLTRMERKYGEQLISQIQKFIPG